MGMPGRIVEFAGPGRARVDCDGSRREISVELLDDVAVGDWVDIHMGFALGTVSEAEAQRTYAFLRQIEQPLDEPPTLGDRPGP